MAFITALFFSKSWCLEVGNSPMEFFRTSCSGLPIGSNQTTKPRRFRFTLKIKAVNSEVDTTRTGIFEEKNCLLVNV